ncbi:Ig-like domain-containing protein, partial [Candidatus Riflebacteria bacterium]
STDADSGVDNSGFVLIATSKEAGNASYSFPFASLVNAGQWSYTWDPRINPNMTPGEYTMSVVATDHAGNRETNNLARPVTYDLTAPTAAVIYLDDELIPLVPGRIVASAVTKLRAVQGDRSSGIDFSRSSFVLNAPGGAPVSAVQSNNASDTFYLNFPALTTNGTYTAILTPVDLAGNLGVVGSTSFVLDTTEPSAPTFNPGSNLTVNRDNTAIANDCVQASFDEPISPATTMELTYNGLTAGNQVTVVGASASVDIDFSFSGGPIALPPDPSKDGRYSVKVTPRDIMGNDGTPYYSMFTLDTQAPTVSVWSFNVNEYIGTSKANLGFSFVLSDSPQDIQTVTGGKAPEDASWLTGPGSTIRFADGQVNLIATGGLTFNNLAKNINVGSSTYDSVFLPMNSNNFPTPAAPPGLGAQPMEFQVVIGDTMSSTAGGVEPPANPSNVATWSRQFIYDPHPPLIGLGTFTTSVKTKADFFPITGSVNDGVLGAMQIARWQVQGQPDWKTLTLTPPAPASVASFGLTFDTRDFADGSQTLVFQAFDQAGNGRQATLVVIIDKTGPPPPTLIYPGDCSSLKERSVTFRWLPQTDGTVPVRTYQVQVSEGIGFEKIIFEDSATDDYKGVRVHSTQYRTVFNKDGTFYWRVASLDELGNVGDYSETFKFSIDSVPPKVLQIFPKPSQSNDLISTGQVTFTIEFNEPMDVTVTPVVKLMGPLGHTLDIIRVKYEGSLYEGTVVIPAADKNFEGNAVIEVSVAQDLAGNTMAKDTSHTVIIDPAPKFDIRLFSNPIRKASVVIVIKSTEPLTAPPVVTVRQSAGASPVVMNFIKNDTYAGTYELSSTAAGIAIIEVTGQDAMGNAGKSQAQFEVTFVKLNAAISMGQTSDTLVHFPRGAVTENMYFTLLPYGGKEDSSETPSMARGFISPKLGITGLSRRAIEYLTKGQNEELLLMKRLATLAPVDFKFSRQITVKTDINSQILKGISPLKAGIFRFNGNAWIYQPTLKKTVNSIEASGAQSGYFALMADLTPPRVMVQEPSEGEYLETSRPEISAGLRDFGAGMQASAIKLYLDGNPLKPDVVDEKSKYVAAKLKKDLSKGAHEIRIEAEDLFGNKMAPKILNVVAPGPFAINHHLPYPNPARRSSTLRFHIGQSADEIKVKIMDSAGHTVRRFDELDVRKVDTGNDGVMYELPWDLRNDSGRRVSNGIFFYKLQVSKDGVTKRSRGKIAVLR